MKIKLQLAELAIGNSCHEDWDKMIPEERGKFCLSCKKAVHDFTSNTAEEIIEFFQKRKLASTCVRVNSNVLHQPAVIGVNGRDKTSLKRLAWFAYALYLVFGSVLFSCHSAVENDNANPNVEYLFDGKSFAKPQQVNSLTEFHERKKPEGVFQKMLQPGIQARPSLPLTPDTIQLPNVDVEGSNRYLFCHTMGEMLYTVYSREFELNDSSDNSDSSGLINSALQDELSVFPNPSGGQFQIHYRITQATPLEIFVFNTSGQFARKIFAVNEIQEGEYTETVNLTDIPAGIYFVRIQIKDHALTRKVIIVH